MPIVHGCCNGDIPLVTMHSNAILHSSVTMHSNAILHSSVILSASEGALAQGYEILRWHSE